MVDSTLIVTADNGNGSFVGISNALRNPIENAVRIEPVIAPLTSGRGLDDKDRPRFSLKIDNKVYVFGVDDVHEFGKKDQIRRSNNAERVGSHDYLMILEAGLLQLLSAYRGKDVVKPHLMLTIPIKQYGNKELVDGLVDSLCHIKAIEDIEGCTLRLNIERKRIQILPEGSAAFWYYAFDPKTLNPRVGSHTTGTSAIVDIGHLTTNVPFMTGVRYDRDLSFTIPRGGMNVITKEVHSFANANGRGYDYSLIDRAMRQIIDKDGRPIALGKPKVVDLGHGTKLDIAPAYDPAAEALARLIADELLNRYSKTLSRTIIVGGGAHHLAYIINDMLPGSMNCITVPRPEDANAVGLWILAKQQAKKAGNEVVE